MTGSLGSEGVPALPALDVARILRALTLAVQEALLRHKQAVHPVAVGRNDRVEWVAPAQIPASEPRPTRGEE